MAEFIRTSYGFINLEHILWIKAGIEREVGEDLVRMSDGQLIQCQIYDRPFEPKPEEPALVGFGEPETDVGRETPKPT